MQSTASLRLLVLALVALLTVPVAAVAQELDRARGRVDDLAGALADATERYEATWAAVEEATAELDRLDRRASQLEVEVVRLESALADRARAVFMRGSGSALELMLAADGPQAGIERASLATLLQTRDAAGVEDAVAARIALDTTVELAHQRRRELEVLSAELVLLQEELEAELETAQRQVQVLEARAARQRTISRGDQQGVYACPLDRHVTHFIDSWGFPRSGGRRHQGTDIMGPMGAPVYAFTSGVIARHSNSRLGGISLYLRGDDGSTYFYAHLQGYAPKGAVGTRVQAGDLIASNGNTGNARGGPAHIHFERHPGGGRPVNPYPFLAAACF